jgi:hypothetical protein
MPEFGMFDERYFQDVPGQPGLREVTPAPVIGELYWYIPVSFLGGPSQELRLGKYVGRSVFGQSLFEPVRD